MASRADFIEQLRATADELGSLAGPDPEPYALAWWANLLTLASMIEAQATPLSAEQIVFLDRHLFGGMGSLNDLRFSREKISDAGEINKRLDRARGKLFSIFKDLPCGPSYIGMHIS